MTAITKQHVLEIMVDSKHEPPRDGGPQEAAHYIAGVVADLASMARRHDLGMLGYLLDMAQMEAEQQVKRRDTRRT